MTSLLFLTIFILHQFPGFQCMTTVEDLTVLEGQSVKVPCFYKPQYSQHVKYWCQGQIKDFCKSLARTDNTDLAHSANGRIRIYDDPSQSTFTVTMQHLKESDSGWYWCGVEIGGIWSVDSTAHLYITVKQGLSVVNSTVSGEEGSSLSIQCRYSEKLRESKKSWCRSGHPDTCQVTGSNGTFSSQSVIISDDQESAFTVTLRKLEMRDAGWYLCEAGQKQASVLISVTARPTPTSPTSTQQSSVIKTQDFSSILFWRSPMMECGILTLILAVFLVLWKIHKQYKKNPEERDASRKEANLMVCPVKGGDWKNTSGNSLNASQQVPLLGHGPQGGKDVEIDISD